MLRYHQSDSAWTAADLTEWAWHLGNTPQLSNKGQQTVRKLSSPIHATWWKIEWIWGESGRSNEDVDLGLSDPFFGIFRHRGKRGSVMQRRPWPKRALQIEGGNA